MTGSWVTLLTQSTYLPGAIALARSLRRVGSRFPLLVMVTPYVDEETQSSLRSEGCSVVEVAPLSPRAGVSVSYAAPQFAEVWTKLRSWELSGFEQVVFLDADMLVLRNMDSLLELGLPPSGIAACHACRCNPHRRKTYPASWVPDNCFYSHVNMATRYTVAGAGDYFNAGLLVLRPDPAVFRAIQERLLALPNVALLPFGEQDLLNTHFANNWQMLPYTYNALKTLAKCHAGLWDLQVVKNLHFILGKPWVCQSEGDDDDYGMLNQLWWDIYGASAS